MECDKIKGWKWYNCYMSIKLGTPIATIEKKLHPLPVLNQDKALETYVKYLSLDMEDMIADGTLDFGDALKNGYTHLVKSIDWSMKGGVIKFEVFNEDKSGYVYLIQADTGAIKIGLAKDIKKRFKSLFTSSPCELKLVYSKRVEDCRLLEKKLHDEFSDKRIKLEWFSLSDIDVTRALEIIDSFTI